MILGDFLSQKGCSTGAFAEIPVNWPVKSLALLIILPILRPLSGKQQQSYRRQPLVPLEEVKLFLNEQIHQVRIELGATEKLQLLNGDLCREG